ncbi:FAD binding domain-containing protein [Actinokineospora sp.]|uniref:FAD binding domain-containing protein n=1 Tax=Actinokineospora sp. TaxID=1872133 RepID=UPI0040382390
MSLDSVVAAVGRGGELRAGGTDVTARQHTGRATGPFVDLGGVPGMRGMGRLPDGSTRIAAMTTVAEIAADPGLRAGYPALTATAGGLATPQIRAAGTLGGNLLQRNRCWYYRNPRFSCFQTGGDGCPAREGAHLYSAVIDQGPCVAPHPSSIAVALLAYDGARVEVHGRGRLPVAQLYGDGSDPTRDHLLGPADVLLAVELPAPIAGERAAYHRAIGRAEAEWPLVEAVARLVVDADSGVIAAAAVAVGGVAHTPLRLPEVESALIGEVANPATLRAAAEKSTLRCAPLPQTGYKVALLRDTVLEVLERAAGVSCDIPRHARRAD